MSSLDPFFVGTGDQSVPSFEDFFSEGSPTEFQPSADFTSGVLATIPQSDGGSKGFFSGLFGSAKGLLGFADDSLDLIKGLDLKSESLFGEGFLPEPVPRQRASVLSGSVAGIPVPLLLAGGGVALYLAMRK